MTDPSAAPVSRRANSIDVDRARYDTPGTARTIHLNNAGAALMPQPVLAAVKGHLDLEAAIGGYEAAEAAEPDRARAYDAIARLLNCSPDEIALVENATRAWDMAFYSIPFTPGDRILTSASEYASNFIAYLQVARRTGVSVEALPSDADGQVSIRALERELGRGRVALVGLTHVPTNGGVVNPVEDVGRLTQAAGVPFLLDACQSVGQRPVDVDAIGCDMLSATGRKFLRGPRGTGFLYVRRALMERLEPPFLDLRAAEWTTLDQYMMAATARRFETWESNVAGTIGLGVAVEYALDIGLEAIRVRVTALAARLRLLLAGLPGAEVRDLGRDRCAIVTFTMAGMDPVRVQEALRLRHINVSVSVRSGTRIDMDARGIDAMLRASVHYYNTDDELEQLIAALRALPRRS